MPFIEAKDKNLATVLSNNRYRIDSFQREYRWQRKHIEALISDLCICFDKFYSEGDTIEDYEGYGGYYMGPIVLCEDKKQLSIVDGQQRLTSFTLLLIFLHHAQRRLALPPNQIRDLKPFLYVNKGGKVTLVLNVEARNGIMQQLIEGLETHSTNTVSENEESINNIIERSEDIAKLFPSDFNTIEKLPIFIEWILDKITLVEVRAFSIENAYTIFETMNDRGLSLNPTEILKGFILSKIEDEQRADEMNEFWKNGISKLRANVGADSDLDFFKAWFRAKYAETIRPNRQGAENEDFEIIGTQFHSWVKNNPSKTFLRSPDDYYYFIRSDFDFYSRLYMNIHSLKSSYQEGFDSLYLSNYYPLADSLTFPLLISSISKIDSEQSISDKIKLVSKFIDVYTMSRVISGKSITQSTIRYAMYDLVKAIRNGDFKLIYDRLSIELDKAGLPIASSLYILHEMDNWGFYHYLLARIRYQINHEGDFKDLMRSKRQNSYVLIRVFNEEDLQMQQENTLHDVYLKSIAAHCLIRRYDLEDFFALNASARLEFLFHGNYLPEMVGKHFDGIIDFIDVRDIALREIASKLLEFKMGDI